MSFYVGSSYFPACISSEKINDILTSDTPSEMSLWEKIKEFFFSNHHHEALDCLFKLYHHHPDISREEMDSLFFQLEALAAPGYKNNFLIEGNSSLEKCLYCITNKNGDNIFSVFYGTE